MKYLTFLLLFNPDGTVQFHPFASMWSCSNAITYLINEGYPGDMQCLETDYPTASIRPMPRPEK